MPDLPRPGSIHDTEDRAFWYEYGETKERAFVPFARRHGLDVRLNPAKTRDRTVIDLLYTPPGGPVQLADLKTQNTPFFTAGRYGKAPGRAVTLNDKDLRRYERLYPDAVILFHVHWTVLAAKYGQVAPLHGIWLGSVAGLLELTAAASTLHTYGRRKTDTRPNAPSSHVLSLDDLICLLEFPQAAE